MAIDIAERLQGQAATLTICGICVAVFVYLWHKKIEPQKVAHNYDRVIVDGQYWRIVTSTFSHLDLMHIFFNVSTLISLGDLERVSGTVEYLKMSFILMLASEAIITLIAFVLITYYNQEGQRRTYAVGYSCVLFGLMTIFYLFRPDATIPFLGFIPVPAALAPFASLLFIQILVPNASFVGHLAGILVGFMYSFGLFRWFDNYVFACSVFWVIIVFFGSLKLTTEFPLPCIHVPDRLDASAPRARTARMVNGVIVVDRPADSDDSGLHAASGAVGPNLV